MKIFLANPPFRIKINRYREKYFIRAGSRWPFSTIKRITEPPEYIPFPFFLAYTAAILQKNGHQVIVDDGVAVNETENEFFNEINKEKPQILLFETATPTADYDFDLAKKIKKKSPKTIICLAGTHASIFAGEILKKHKTIDFIFLGEYELNFAEFVENMAKKKSLKDINGIGFREKRQIIINNSKAIDPLDTLPFPARDLFPSSGSPNPSLYWDGFCQHKPSIQMHASRGCPFRCNFCLWNQVLYRNGKYRMFSPKRIVDEMLEVMKSYGAKEVYFDDDTFTADKQQVLLICKEIIKRKLKVFWSVMGDAMVTDEETIKAMAGAGCIGIKFGVESGSKEILKKIGKPIDFEKVKNFTKWCAENKIKTHATFTFGLSGETKESMDQTLEFAKELDVDSVQFSLTTPFPGTRYYQELKEKGFLNIKEWVDFDGSSSTVVKYENFNRSYIIDYCKKASGRWLLSKLKDFTWLKRQIYNMSRQVKGQGILFVIKRLKKGLSLIFNR